MAIAVKINDDVSKVIEIVYLLSDIDDLCQAAENLKIETNQIQIHLAHAIDAARKLLKNIDSVPIDYSNIVQFEVSKNRMGLKKVM